METLNLGTAEIFSVQLNDLLGQISDLSSYTVQQRIISEDEKTIAQDWTDVDQVVGMRVDCLIDTETWDEGNYKLFVKIDISPESVIKGPFPFGVS